MHLACTLSSFPQRNKITSPRACVLLFRRRKSFIFISCSSDWLYANEFVLGVRNCGGKNNFASRAAHDYAMYKCSTMYVCAREKDRIGTWNKFTTNYAIKCATSRKFGREYWRQYSPRKLRHSVVNIGASGPSLILANSRRNSRLRRVNLEYQRQCNIKSREKDRLGT